PGEPGLDGRFAGEAGSALKRGKQGVLDHVLGELVVAKLQACDAQEIAAMGIELGNEIRAGHGVRENPGGPAGSAMIPAQGSNPMLLKRARRPPDAVRTS